MRKISIWRDDERQVYAIDEETNIRYYFHDYAGAISANPAIKEIVSRELLEDIIDFSRWFAGQDISFHSGIGAAITTEKVDPKITSTTIDWQFELP